jgi:hypothetical protein
MFLNLVSVLTTLNSKNKETEEKTVGNAKIKSLRLEQHYDWQWKNRDDSYCLYTSKM